MSIDWPITPVEVSPKDESWPSFDAEFHGVEQMRDLIPNA